MEKSDSNEILDTGNLVASTKAPATTVAPAPTAAETEQVKLVNVPVTDDNVAFNLIISFLNLAQRRGVYTIDESAKIWECVKRFQRPS